MLRKVAVAAASNPHVEIRQDGEKFYIKTSTSVRTTEINFQIGQEFDEETVDGRKCKVKESPRPRRRGKKTLQVWRWFTPGRHPRFHMAFEPWKAASVLLRAASRPPAGWYDGHVRAAFELPSELLLSLWANSDILQRSGVHPQRRALSFPSHIF